MEMSHDVSLVVEAKALHAKPPSMVKFQRGASCMEADSNFTSTLNGGKQFGVSMPEGALKAEGTSAVMRGSSQLAPKATSSHVRSHSSGGSSQAMDADVHRLLLSVHEEPHYRIPASAVTP